MILILGEQCDPHIRKVCGHLRDLDCRYLVVDPFETVHLPGLMHPDPGRDRYTAVWDRLKPVSAPRSHRDQYILRERIAAIRGIQWSHPRGALLNPPGATEAARSKPLQLKLAHGIGFDTPRTYVGNDARGVRSFVASCRQGAVVKNLTWYFDEAGRFSFTNLVTPEMLRSSAVIACSPLIYQEYVPKSYELRVTCVGQKIFAAKVLSQANPKTLVDWRRDQFNLTYEAVSLENGLEQKIARLLQELGLHFGAIDFIVTPAGRHVFLEVNSSGNWLWLERRAPLPISSAVAHWLRDNGAAGRSRRR